MLNVAIVDYYLWTIIVDYHLWTIIADYYLWTINVDYYWWHSQGFSRVMHQRSCTRGKLFCKRNNHPYELSSSLGCLSDIEIEHQLMILENDLSSVAACLWSAFGYVELFTYFSIWRFRAWFNFFAEYYCKQEEMGAYSEKKTNGTTSHPACGIIYHYTAWPHIWKRGKVRQRQKHCFLKGLKMERTAKSSWVCGAINHCLRKTDCGVLTKSGAGAPCEPFPDRMQSCA